MSRYEEEQAAKVSREQRDAEVAGACAHMVEKLARLGLDSTPEVRTQLFNAQTTLEAVYRKLRGLA